MLLRILAVIALIIAPTYGRAGVPVDFISHEGIALHGEPKYTSDFGDLPDFKHFDYVNPDAPKGGEIRLSDTGSFDSVHPFILKGVAATGAALPFDTLMEKSADEPFSQYGLIAKNVAVAPDRSWVQYELRPEARFHDGQPVTAEDVIFSFTVLKDKGRPAYRSYYKDVLRVEAFGAHKVRFTFKDGSNNELPLIIGELPVLPKHFWKDKDFTATTLHPIPGSGPYKIAKIDPGRSITYERVKDWWAQDLPVARGRHNFDRIRFDYYRDETVEIEALLAGRYDVRQENTAKNWAIAYNTPAVKSGAIIKQEIKNEMPSGMQGFVLNLRNALFQDVRVREALDLAFDFEWSNKNVAYGAYTRSNSYFANSELAATGLPSAGELKILEPYRGKIPEEVFTKEYKEPVTGGSGNNRANLRRAGELLKAAGWELKNGKLVNAKTGKAFTFTLLESSLRFERWLQPYLRNLERLGIKIDYRVADSAQYQNRLDNFDFDMVINTFPQSLSPGNEQRDYWSSAKAEIIGSRNIIGLQNDVVDALVEGIIAAKDRPSLIDHCRALDRVLLWGHYVIPHWHIGIYRLAYWDKFGQPAIAPKYGLGFLDTWWIDPGKAAKLRQPNAH